MLSWGQFLCCFSSRDFWGAENTIPALWCAVSCAGWAEGCDGCADCSGFHQPQGGCCCAGPVAQSTCGCNGLVVLQEAAWASRSFLEGLVFGDTPWVLCGWECCLELALVQVEGAGNWLKRCWHVHLGSFISKCPFVCSEPRAVWMTAQ